MADTASHLALRQMRALAQPKALAIFAGLGVILAILAPFGTDETLRAVPRALYWGGLGAATYCVGTVTNALSRAWMPRRAPDAVRVGGAALANAVAIPPLVLAVNWLLFGIWPDALWGFVATIAGLAVVISVLLALIDWDPPEAAAEPSAPALLERLPLDKRGALIALSVEDHYVRIRTEAGEAMVLMRLGDAIRETAPVAGLQVHRSHWVALDAVTAAERQGDRAILRMAVGPDIPASRANVPKLRAAGLLPR